MQRSENRDYPPAHVADAWEKLFNGDSCQERSEARKLLLSVFPPFQDALAHAREGLNAGDFSPLMKLAMEWFALEDPQQSQGAAFRVFVGQGGTYIFDEDAPPRLPIDYRNYEGYELFLVDTMASIDSISTALKGHIAKVRASREASGAAKTRSRGIKLKREDLLIFWLDCQGYGAAGIARTLRPRHPDQWDSMRGTVYKRMKELRKFVDPYSKASGFWKTSE